MNRPSSRRQAIPRWLSSFGLVAALTLTACGTSKPDSDASVDARDSGGPDLRVDSASDGVVMTDAHDAGGPDLGQDVADADASIDAHDDAPADAPPSTDGPSDGPKEVGQDVGSPEVASDTAPDVAADVKPAVDVASDVADAVSDGADATPPILPHCGNGLLEPTELCETVGDMCIGCGLTYFGACKSTLIHAENVCKTLDATTAVKCWAALNCMSRSDFMCATLQRQRCYCTNPGVADCPQGADGPCAAELAALAGTNVPSAVLAQINDATSIVGRVTEEARQYTFNGTMCLSSNITHFAGKLVINEVRFSRSATLTDEFVEIVNGTKTTVNLTNYNVTFYRKNGGNFYEPFLTVPVSGTLGSGEYLVIGSPTVTVATGVRKIPFAMSSGNISPQLSDVILSNGVDSAFVQEFDGGVAVDIPDPNTGSWCRAFDGMRDDNNKSWSRCTNPTPAGPNQN